MCSSETSGSVRMAQHCSKTFLLSKQVLKPRQQVHNGRVEPSHARSNCPDHHHLESLENVASLNFPKLQKEVYIYIYIHVPYSERFPR
jgi:hypothetical protein